MEGDALGVRVLFYQAYTCDYIRHQSILKGLRENDVKVIECIDNRMSPLRYVSSIIKFIRLVDGADVVLANWRVFENLWLLRLLTRKPIVYDAFLSVWQTLCHEKKTVDPSSIFGKLLFRIEKYNLEIADHIICDTYAHMRYFSKTFGIEQKKFTRVLISCEKEIDVQTDECDGNSVPTVFWCGSGIPLQGLDIVYEANP